MKILVTGGGTTEYIDDVRVLTNISTGALAARIAYKLEDKGHDITYVCAKSSVRPQFTEAKNDDRIKTVTDVASLFTVMKEWVPHHDVVIHAMAVSDFGFKRNGSVKLKSNSPESFIDHMRQNIVVNPKIISHIKEWNPGCVLVGFKFEVGKKLEDLIAIATESFRKNKCDVVIANDKEMMKAAHEHVALAIQDSCVTTLNGKEDISNWLVNYVGSL